MPKFEEALAGLNAAQRQAVDAIDGPVMVIAGPGTGKTQLLSVRIGNILKKTQVNPENILCLTYTDSGATAMRNRLVSLVGPEGHRVAVSTFHAFGNAVIQNHRDYFGIADLSPASDLDVVEILDELIVALPPENPLKKFNSQTADIVKRLKNFFQEVKKENMNIPQLTKDLAAYSADLPFRDEFIYKRKTGNFKVGDVKEHAVKKERERIDKAVAALNLFEPYNAEMKKRGLYDYEDMLQWVIKAFEQEDWMLASYQEKYQYMLVDEFQDNNGSQNRILTLLTTFWGDKANLFVVGDDDQSVYSFQGARMHRMEEFVERYRANLQAVVLQDNYRSSQTILDHAGQLIVNNLQRLTNNTTLIAAVPGLHKNLKAHYKPDSNIRAIAYLNAKHEAAAIADALEKIAYNGERLNEVAVIYRNHKHVEALTQVLTERKIPFFTRRPENLLEIPLVKNILNLCQWAIDERGKSGETDDRLYQSLYYPYFNIAPYDLALLSYHMRQINDYKSGRPKSYWRMAISDELLLKEAGVGNAEPFIRLSKNWSQWLSDLSTYTPQLWLEKLLMESGIMAWALQQEDKYWHVQVIETLFDQLKEMSAYNPSIGIAEFLSRLQRMEAHNLTLPMQRSLGTHDGAQLITAHSSKGLEFDTVFIIGCQEGNWEKKRAMGADVYLPLEVLGLDKQEENEREEEERRLFYVAATRARKNLEISWYRMESKDNDPQSASGKRSMFVDEWMGPGMKPEEVTLSEDGMLRYLSESHGIADIEGLILDASYMNQWLQDYSMSVTHLSKYLRCPVTFYFENVLRVPSARSSFLGFGNAVHEALRSYFEQMLAHPQQEFAEAETLIAMYLRSLRHYASHFTADEYKQRVEQAEPLLVPYLQARLPEWIKDTKVEFNLNNVSINGMLMNGKIDRMDLLNNSLQVIDYKTGKKDSARAKLKPPVEMPDSGSSFEQRYGGDYWRQAVFYKLLLGADKFYHNWTVSVYFDLVESGINDGQFEMVQVPIDRMQEEMLMEQINMAWDGIHARKFSKGCGEEGCFWCGFVTENKLQERLAAQV